MISSSLRNMRSPISLATQSTVAVQRPTPPLAAKRVQRASSWAAIRSQFVLLVMVPVNLKELFRWSGAEVLVDSDVRSYSNVLGYAIEFGGYIGIMRIAVQQNCSRR